jgi:hypothetical protein
MPLIGNTARNIYRISCRKLSALEEDLPVKVIQQGIRLAHGGFVLGVTFELESLLLKRFRPVCYYDLITISVQLSIS